MVVKGLALTVIALALIAAGCGSAKKPAASNAAAAPKGAHTVGDKVTLSDGMTAQLKAVAFPAQPSDGTPTPPQQVVALLVEVCAGSKQANVTGFQWSVRLADNTAAQVSLGEIDPQFINATLAPGECNAGNVTFISQAGQAPKSATFKPSANSNDLALWAL